MARQLNYIINTIISFIMLLLLLRLVMRLLDANPATYFTELVYSTSAFFLAPFQGIFPTPAVEGSVLELSTLFAIIIYGLLGWVIAALFSHPSVSRTRRVTIEKDM